MGVKVSNEWTRLLGKFYFYFSIVIENETMLDFLVDD